jgi:PAS domain S-box-containing protein
MFINKNWLKIIVLVVLTIISLAAIYFFELQTGARIHFTRILYIPIILAGFWYRWKSIAFAVLLVVFLLVFDNGIYGSVIPDDYLQSAWLIVVSILVSSLSNYMNKAIVAMEELKNREALQESKEKAKSITEVARDAIITINSQGQVTYWNPAAERILGYQAEEALGQNLHEFLVSKDLHPLYEKGFAEFVKTGTGMAVGKTLELTAVKKDGTVIPVELSLSAYKIKGEWNATGIIRDISERIKAQEAISEQIKFSESLIQSLAVPTFVLDSEHKVVYWNKACEIMTECSAEDMIGTKNQWQGFYDHSRPVMADLIIDNQLDNLTSLYSFVSESDFALRGLHAEGWFKNIGSKEKRYMFFDAAPILNIKGEVVAAIETLQDITALKEAEEIIREKNLKMQKELEIAAVVQRRLMPEIPPEIPGLSVFYEFKPSIYVAGDMFDVFQIDQRHTGFYVMDVMGHGVSAAFKAVILNYLLKQMAKLSEMLKPGQAVSLLNDYFCDENKDNSFVTIFYGILDLQEMKLTYTRAGQCPPIFINSAGEVRELSQGDPAVGFLPDFAFKDYVVDFKKGDRFFVYTDGIIEAENKSEECFSKDRLIKILTDHRQKALNEVTGQLFREITQFSGTEDTKDDLTFLGIEITL